MICGTASVADTMRGAEKLSATKVAKLSEPGRYGDGRGLWLHIGPAGNKSWVLRFMRDGKPREMGLGALDIVGLSDARERARDARKVILNGFDPLESRREHRTKAKIEAVRGIAFKDAAEKFLEAHESTWVNEKHRAQWRSTLETFAYPTIGKLPVGGIDTALVLKVLSPIWTKKPETAARLQQRIKRILDWAKARSYRSGDNPAAWAGHLDKLLPGQNKAKRVKHHAALRYDETPTFMASLRGNESISARALEFTILCATRTGETIGALWSEINFALKLWTIPGVRMKSGREHRVPLCDRALEILKTIPRENSFIFPGAKLDCPLSNMAMLELLKGLKPELTVHGFRSTFKDWTTETTNYPNIVSEAALAHVVDDKTEAAYRRGDLFEKRRRLMRDWAKFCALPAVERSDVVVSLKSAEQ